MRTPDLDGRDHLADRLPDEADWLRQCAGWLRQALVTVDLARVQAVIDRIAADVDELARARRAGDLTTAAVLGTPRRSAARRY